MPDGALYDGRRRAPPTGPEGGSVLTVHVEEGGFGPVVTRRLLESSPQTPSHRRQGDH